ncbi:gp58-like family protein [Pediococcus pentosaceus]|uniref:gp58-like family protein n=1 Tax=Pediococcus pentosaceus TaxID=1255 RepID=UPI001F2DCCCB|nr:gp58-like family protein [Pediococcus pentosaceus]
MPDIDEALSTANLVKQNVTKPSNTTEQYHNEYTTGIQNVIKTIDDITIGGTNLIKDSSSDVVIDDTVNNQGWAHSTIYSELEAGQEYTFTSSVTVNAGKADNICINVYNPNTRETTLASNRPVVNGKIEYTFTAVKDFPQLLAYAGTPGGTNGNKVTLHHYQLEKGNKATDWAPAPEDLATSTEIDQLNNAIKLKANSTDVTSQITVAISGIQKTVNNKADKSQVSQLADQITSVVSDVSEGKTNLIVNGGFENGTDNWIFEDVSSWSINKNNGHQPFTEDYIRITPDGKGYITQKLVRFNGLSVSDWNFNFYYNIQNNVSGYVKAYLRIDYEDGTFKHINDTKLTANNNAWQRMSVKINKADLSAVAGISLRLQFTGASGGGNVYYSQFQISRGADDKPCTKSDLDNVNQSQMTQLKDDVNLRVSKNDVVNQINISNEGILIDGKKVHITGNTSIDNAVIKNTMIANAAINTAQIADGAINNAKIANASIDDAKINSLNGNKLVENSITANKINVDDLIANDINTKTLTSVNLNTSTLTTPQLDLGLNGTFTEDFDYTQATSMFLPKKNKGTLTFDHGSLQSKGDMQTYVDGKWGGMNDDYTFQAGIDNSQWTEVAPGYIKLDLFKQNDADVGQRTYIDPTGYYYTSRNGIASYLGNVLQTAQVQTSSMLTKYIGPTDGKSRLQIGSNGNHYGLQVGPYAGNEAVLSDFIYDSTTSGTPNVNITANGHLVRSTSASKYKYNIKNPDIETTLGDRLLNVHLATWNDKRAVDLYVEQLSTGEEREKSSIDKYYGLIAEQLRDAGLDMFINYGKNHEIEGIQYDRAWVPLLSVIRRLNGKVNEYELRLSKLEGVGK